MKNIYAISKSASPSNTFPSYISLPILCPMLSVLANTPPKYLKKVHLFPIMSNHLISEIKLAIFYSL